MVFLTITLHIERASLALEDHDLHACAASIDKMKLLKSKAVYHPACICKKIMISYNFDQNDPHLLYIVFFEYHIMLENCHFAPTLV